jgi:hypothetical protein
MAALEEAIRLCKEKTAGFHIIYDSVEGNSK